MNVLYVLLSVGAAALAGCGFVLQQHAAEQVQDEEFLRLGLISRLVRNRRWLTGVLVMVCGYLLQAWTLGHLDLSVTEPLITTSLIFALILAVPLSGQALRKTEVIGALLLSAGVAVLSLTRNVKAPSASFRLSTHWPAEAAIALIAVLLVLAGRRQSGTLRATLTGTAAGLMLGIADAFTRRTVLIIDSKYPLHLLNHPTGYAAAVASLIGLWLMQNAFNAAPLHASLPAVTAAEPAAGMVLGVLVFGDKVHISPWLIAVQILGVVAMVIGVVVVARAPVFRDLRLRELPHAALERLQHPLGEAPSDTAPPAGVHGHGQPDSPVEQDQSTTPLAVAGQSYPEGEQPAGTTPAPAC
jgi:drug/metabolite transporter (DMT)-like permease